jgi:asparagine synthase (glutamine-hydrolysing)
MDGLYALASLDGAPLAIADGATLGLAVAPGSRFAVELRDARAGARDVGDGWAFLGRLSEAEALATELGFDRRPSHGVLAVAAFDRWGEAARSRLLGEWSLVRWHGPGATLTLAASEPVRDTLFFATDGRRVAVAPDLLKLRRLPWVDGRWDERGLLLQLGRADTRALLKDETVVRGVRRVVHGTTVTIGREVRAGFPIAWRPPDPYRGGFDDLMAEADALLRTIVADTTAPHADVALLLSGGLDSSLLAAQAAATRRPDQRLTCLSSAAPPTSGLSDETGFARAVAEPLGLPLRPVWPDGRADLYRPSSRMLGTMTHPLASPAHYLFEALYEAAVGVGADLVLDGAYGELSVSGYGPPFGWRERLHQMRRTVHVRMHGGLRVPSAQAGFHARLSPPALALAEPLVAETRMRARDVPSPSSGRTDLWGYLPGAAKNLGGSTSTGWPGLRCALPFRDRRLLDLFAAMPARFSLRDGLGRAPARALLRGRVPEEVRLRPRGLPFSPDYLQRAVRDAAGARDLLAGYRRAGVGDWLDLDWLDRQLAGVGQSAPALDRLFQIQSTAIAAAFIGHHG